MCVTPIAVLNERWVELKVRIKGDESFFKPWLRRAFPFLFFNQFSMRGLVGPSLLTFSSFKAWPRGAFPFVEKIWVCVLWVGAGDF